VVNLIASVLLVGVGLYLALVADLDETSDMRTFGWVIVAAGVLGVIASLVFPRIGQGPYRP
jgi:uncharacterized membrane protein YvlD (DUF360 family)